MKTTNDYKIIMYIVGCDNSSSLYSLKKKEYVWNVR